MAIATGDTFGKKISSTIVKLTNRSGQPNCAPFKVAAINMSRWQITFSPAPMVCTHLGIWLPIAVGSKPLHKLYIRRSSSSVVAVGSTAANAPNLINCGWRKVKFPQRSKQYSGNIKYITYHT